LRQPIRPLVRPCDFPVIAGMVDPATVPVEPGCDVAVVDGVVDPPEVPAPAWVLPGCAVPVVDGVVDPGVRSGLLPMSPAA